MPLIGTKEFYLLLPGPFTVKKTTRRGGKDSPSAASTSTTARKGINAMREERQRKGDQLLIYTNRGTQRGGKRGIEGTVGSNDRLFYR